MDKQITLLIIIAFGLNWCFHVNCHLDSVENINNETRRRIFNMWCQHKCGHELLHSDHECCNMSLSGLQSPLISLPENITTELYCKEPHLIVLKIDSLNLKIENWLHFVEVLDRNVPLEWTFYKLFNDTKILDIHGLQPHTEYKIRIWFLSNAGRIYTPIESNWIRTPLPDKPPLPISSIELDNITLVGNDYRALVTWTASPDKSCEHEIIWFGSEDISDYHQIEVAIPSNFTITLHHLMFNSNYSLGISTKSSDGKLESEKVWLHINTKHCHEVMETLEYCEPKPPLGIRAHEKFISSRGDEFLYNVFVDWIRPSIMPSFYILHLNAFKGDNDTLNRLNITGDSVNATFWNVTLNLHYQVTIFAYSNGGRSDPTEYYKQLSYKDFPGLPDEHFDVKSFLFIIVPLLILIFIILAILLSCKKLNQRDQVLKRQRYFEELELKSHYLDTEISGENIINESIDEWEIDLSSLTLQCVLGRGAFGIVRKGLLKTGTSHIAVAVKMLQEDHRFADIRDFKQEIEIMKSVGSHPNIVSLIGCYTQGKAEDLRLIVEYCARGDLLTYLRCVWDHVTNQHDNTQYANVNNFDNKLYWMNRGDDSDVEFEDMQIKDLISIGLQVAMGMEYLASLHVLHRDLAARNVLVCEDRTVKVSDFGLSRDVYRDNVYCKTTSGKLPIRWLAIESLTHQLYTTQSDIWSFGILFWEIITLGGNPYPGVQTQELLDFLIRGNRMERPFNCSPELYCLMMKCWRSNPKDRPSFTEIRKFLECILEHSSDYLKLSLSVSMQSLNYDNCMMKMLLKSTSLSSERYVKAFAH